MELSVFGNIQVLSHASVIQYREQEFKICSLPGLCILKLIAAHDRPERLKKDLGDFYYILENYFEISGNELFENKYEDLIDDDFVPVISATKMLGRQLVPIINESSELRNRIIAILVKLKEGFSDEEIDQMYEFEKKDTKILRFKLIRCISEEVTKLGL